MVLAFALVAERPMDNVGSMNIGDRAYSILHGDQCVRLSTMRSSCHQKSSRTSRQNCRRISKARRVWATMVPSCQKYELRTKPIEPWAQLWHPCPGGRGRATPHCCVTAGRCRERCLLESRGRLHQQYKVRQEHQTVAQRGSLHFQNVGG